MLFDTWYLVPGRLHLLLYNLDGAKLLGTDPFRIAFQRPRHAVHQDTQLDSYKHPIVLLIA